jgi:hypothetical protein
MKIIYSRNPNGIKKYESKSEAISYLKSIGYEKSGHSRINVAIKTKGVAYGFRWSENVIDLIEVGDYVNGCEVVEKRNGMIYAGKCPDCYYYEIVTNYPKAIETIVTKEQFNSIKYVIGE